MAKKLNPNSLLFLYEGETEAEFYKLLFNEYIPPKKNRRNYGDLKGVYNLNKKVNGKILNYLSYKDSHDFCKIHIFVARLVQS